MRCGLATHYKLIIGGDLFPSDKNMQQFIDGSADELFDSRIRELFHTADYAICNLEGALTNEEIHIKKVDPVIKAAPESVKGIIGLGVDCVTLANNHIIDYGKKGYLDTIRTLDENGIRYFGAGPDRHSISSHFQLPFSEKKVIVYTAAETMFNVPGEEYPGVNLYDDYLTCSEISALKKECDYLIVIYHGGTEFFWYNSELMRSRFRRMADCGADLITAQHTHCVGIQENYHGSHLLYGQGDFLFARSVNEYKETGLLIEVDFGDDIVISRHLVRHIGGKVEYDPEQDFSAFDARTKAFLEGNSFFREYKEFSDKKLIMFLEAFRGKNLIDKIIRKILPRDRYADYLRSRYSEKQLLRMISGIEFEEYRESVITGLWNLVKSEQRQ